MEIFSALLALCAGHSQVTDEFPSQSQRRRALMSSLICALNKRLSKKIVRRHRVHYDVIVLEYVSQMIAQDLGLGFLSCGTHGVSLTNID